MRLWTIQPLAVDEIIRKNGYYVCDISKSPYSLACESFKKAYDWMNEQMEKRIGPMPEDVTYPIWAWHSWDFKHVKPDLRRTEFRVIEDSIMYEVELPSSDVLLSDFDNWHYVLNDWYLSSTWNEKDWENEEAWFDSLPQDIQKQKMLESWERIFDIEPYETDFAAKGKFVQATFWKLREKDIINRKFVKKKPISRS